MHTLTLVDARAHSAWDAEPVPSVGGGALVRISVAAAEAPFDGRNGER